MRAMKDSGIKWIGEIPEEWEVVPFKSYFKLSKGLNITKENLVPNGIPVISYGQVHSKSNTGTSVNADLIKYVPKDFLETNPNCLLSVGSFIFADTSEDKEGCGNAVYVNDKTNPFLFAGYHTIIANPKQYIKNKYLAYLFLTDCWRTQIRSMVTGIKVYSINQKCLNASTIICPPFSEQQRIATYLDTKCGEIDELIGIQEKFIEELKAYKQSVITEAVTKGLNPNATLKDSGVEWIGEIPEDWKVVRLKFLCKNEKYAIKTGPFGSQLKGDDLKEYGDTCVYTQRNVIDNDFSTKYSYVNSDKAAQLSSFLTKKNDLLLTSRGTIGRCAILSEHEEMGILHPCLIAIRLDEDKCLNQWLQIYFNHTSCFRTDIQKKSNGTTIEVVYTENLKNTFIPICSIDEQKIIIDKITATSSQIDSLITLKQSKIEELKSFKKSLIYEYVTGKKTVPENV